MYAAYIILDATTGELLSGAYGTRGVATLALAWYSPSACIAGVSADGETYTYLLGEREQP